MLLSGLFDASEFLLRIACFCPRNLPLCLQFPFQLFFSALPSPIPPGPLCNTLPHQSNHSLFLIRTSGGHILPMVHGGKAWIPPTAKLHLFPACLTMAGGPEPLSQLAFPHVRLAPQQINASPGLMIWEERREQGAKVATTRCSSLCRRPSCWIQALQLQVLAAPSSPHQERPSSHESHLLAQ